MALTGAQHAQIQKALLAAFDEADLRQLLLHELDADLDAVAGGENKTEVVFNLVKWANQTGCVARLIDGALRQNPTNPFLQDLAKSAKMWRLDASEEAGTPGRLPATDEKRAVSGAGWAEPQCRRLDRRWPGARRAGDCLAPLAAPPQAAAPAATVTAGPELPTPTPVAQVTPPPTAALPATPPDVALTAAGAGPASTPAPLAAAISPFADCPAPDPAAFLYKELQNALRQHNAADAVEITLLPVGPVAPAAGEPPYAIILGGRCTPDGTVVYTADLPLVGDGRGERVAEPTRLELPWPAGEAPPAKTLAALLIYHAQEGSYGPVTLLSQEEGTWDDAPDGARLALQWLMGNALLDHPGRMEERARQHYQQAIDIVPTVPGSARTVAALHNNRGWAYYMQARKHAQQSGAEAEITRTYYLSATQEFRQAVELYRAYPMAWTNLGDAYAGLRDYAQAHESCDQAILLGGHFTPAFVCKAKAHYLAVELSKAVEQAELALAGDSPHPLAYYLAGLSLCYLEEPERSSAALRAYLDLRPSLSRWDKYPPSLVEAQKILQGIASNTLCEW